MSDQAVIVWIVMGAGLLALILFFGRSTGLHHNRRDRNRQGIILEALTGLLP